MFNYSNNINVNMIPISLVKNKLDLLEIIKETNGISNLKGFFYKSNDCYIFKIKGYKDGTLVYSKRNKIYLNCDNKRCLYCSSEIQALYKIYIENMDFNFCSLVCKGSFSKIIERYFELDEQINIYLPPIIFFEDKLLVKNLINNTNKDFIYGGFKDIINNKIHVIILTKN